MHINVCNVVYYYLGYYMHITLQNGALIFFTLGMIYIITRNTIYISYCVRCVSRFMEYCKLVFAILYFIN